MDLFLGKVTQHAMNYAIRSGIGLTASFAIKQSTKLLSTAPKSTVRDELYALQQRLQHKIRIVSPAIDMIELIAARGNTTLESAVALTKELRLEIQSLGQRLATAASASADAARKGKISAQVEAQNELEMKLIVSDIKKLLDRIEDAVPLINLAITTSGASLSTSLPRTVSPSRLLQASTFLTAGDTQYSMYPQHAVQIGPTFTLTIYMLFAGHDRPQNEEEVRETTWKEVIHKAKVKLRRVPLDVVVHTGSGSEAIPSAHIISPGPVPNQNTTTTIPADARADEYAYQIMIIEDFDDDRYHDFEEDQAQPGAFDDVKLAGIREMIPIHEISKIFYADTSKVLNIGSDAESNHPVLLLKRDLNAVPPRRMMREESLVEGEDEQYPEVSEERQSKEQQYVTDDHQDRNYDPWRLPPSLDPEWIAFEVYAESEVSDSDSDLEEQEPNNSTRLSPATSPSPSNLATSLSKMHLRSSPSPSPQAQTQLTPLPTASPPPWANQILTSLSLLELLLRLTSLQQFQQQSHLCITDELLNFFLEESASTGAGGNEQYRQTLRADARRRVGWDPYDESPVKRRGEEYLGRYAENGGAAYTDKDWNVREYTPSIASRSVGGTPRGGSGLNGAGASEAWSPRDLTDRRSITGASDFHASPSPSPSPSAMPMPVSMDGRNRSRNGRTSWLKREDGRSLKGSPLRPSTALTDEGIGTSPVSSGGDGRKPGE